MSDTTLNTTLTNENTLDEFDGILPTTPVLACSWLLVVAAIILSIASCILCCCQCCQTNKSSAREDVPRRRRRSGVQGKHIYLTTATIVLLLSSFLAAGYATARRVLDVQDYKGKMRVVGWSADNTVQTARKSKESSFESDRRVEYFEHSIRAELQVNWGYAWACPDHGDKACTTHVGSGMPKCERILCTTSKEDDRCSQDDWNAATADVANCANGIFDPTLVDSGYYVPYDPQQGPSQDENWPHVVAYGNCNNCQVQDTAPRPGALEGMRIAVIVVLVLSFGMVGSAAVWLCRPAEDIPHGTTTAAAIVEMPVLPAAAPLPGKYDYTTTNNSNNIQYNGNHMMVVPAAGPVVYGANDEEPTFTVSPVAGGQVYPPPTYNHSNIPVAVSSSVVHNGVEYYATTPPVATAPPVVYGNPASK